MTRVYADADALGMQILRAVILAPVTVQEIPVPDLGAAVADGLVVARRVSGAASGGPWGYVDRCTFAVDIWKVGRTAALNLAEDCRTAFHDSVSKPYPAGSVSAFVEQAGPVEFRTGIELDGVTQVNALYELYICPP